MPCVICSHVCLIASIYNSWTINMYLTELSMKRWQDLVLYSRRCRRDHESHVAAIKVGWFCVFLWEKARQNRRKASKYSTLAVLRLQRHLWWKFEIVMWERHFTATLYDMLIEKNTRQKIVKWMKTRKFFFCEIYHVRGRPRRDGERGGIRYFVNRKARRDRSLKINSIILKWRENWILRREKTAKYR